MKPPPVVFLPEARDDIDSAFCITSGNRSVWDTVSRPPSEIKSRGSKKTPKSME